MSRVILLKGINFTFRRRVRTRLRELMVSNCNLLTLSAVKWDIRRMKECETGRAEQDGRISRVENTKQIFTYRMVCIRGKNCLSNNPGREIRILLQKRSRIEFYKIYNLIREEICYLSLPWEVLNNVQGVLLSKVV